MTVTNNPLSTLRLLLTAIIAICATSARAATTSAPPLIVTITVEGLSSEYLRQLDERLTPGGFQRLANGGATITNIDFGPGIDAAAGQAIVMTGAAPAVNGIPAAKVYDVTSKLPRSPLYDKAMMGNFTDETYSAAPLKVSTLSDELRIATDGAGRAYAIAPYSHEAIIAAAHAGNGAVWINEMTGNWASTTYYKEMPVMFKDRNYRSGLPERLDTMRWSPLLDLNLYPGLNEVERRKGFRNSYPRKDVQRVRRFLQSPLANSEITTAAIDLIRNESLGRKGSSDMIAVSYTLPTSATRAEIIDSYMRLDRDLNRLVEAAQQATGNRALIMLTGLPSAEGAPADDHRWNIPSGLYSVKRALSLLGIQMMAVHGNGEWILGYHNRHFYLNRQLIKDRGMSLQDFRTEVADFLARMEGISNVMTIDEIIASRAGDNPAAIKRNTSPTHAGDVIIEVSPGWQIVDDGSGRASAVQRHTAPEIPAYIIGPDIKRLQIDGITDARVLAPTLARLMLVRAPNGASLPALSL